MHCFWRHGFEATSVDALVKSVGISQQGLYGDFGGKEALFAACLETYSREVVSPAFAQVEFERCDDLGDCRVFRVPDRARGGCRPPGARLP